MRILHVNLASGWRGGERQTLLLMQGLREHDVESELLARAGGETGRRARAAGFPVMQTSTPYFSSVVKLRGFDIVHVHETKALQVAAIGSLLNSSRLVVTRRVDFIPGCNFFTRWKYRRAARVVAVSQFVSNVLGEWGLPEAAREVIYDAAADPAPVDARRVSELRERFAGRRVIGCVAALVISHKDQITLLRAFEIVQRVYPDVALVLVGEGGDRALLEDEARRIGLANVHFEGFQCDPRLYYAVFDVFALTSRVEGLGSAVLEAFADGVPVVATDAGGLPEIVQHERTGWLAPVGDHEAVARGIERFLSDSAFAESCAARAGELQRQRHTPRAMAQAYLRVYRDV